MLQCAPNSWQTLIWWWSCICVGDGFLQTRFTESKLMYAELKLLEFTEFRFNKTVPPQKKSGRTFFCWRWWDTHHPMNYPMGIFKTNSQLLTRIQPDSSSVYCKSVYGSSAMAASMFLGVKSFMPMTVEYTTVHWSVHKLNAWNIFIEGSLNRNFRQYGQLKSRVE